MGLCFLPCGIYLRLFHSMKAYTHTACRVFRYAGFLLPLPRPCAMCVYAQERLLDERRPTAGPALHGSLLFTRMPFGVHKKKKHKPLKVITGGVTTVRMCICVSPSCTLFVLCSFRFRLLTYAQSEFFVAQKALKSSRYLLFNLAKICSTEAQAMPIFSFSAD